MIGELVSDDKVTWSVYRKGSRGNTDIPEEEYEANKIGHFCLRPVIVPLSSSKARVTLLVFPLTKEELETQHAHSGKAAFPGLELMTCDVDMFPRMNKDTGKSWGCPIIPLICLVGDMDKNRSIPSTDDIKAAISATLRATVIPVTKRDLRTLAAAWQSIQESGPTKLKERSPDTLWPLWTRKQQSQNGKIWIM